MGLILVILDEVIRWLLATTWELVFLAFLADLVDKLVDEDMGCEELTEVSEFPNGVSMKLLASPFFLSKHFFR